MSWLRPFLALAFASFFVAANAAQGADKLHLRVQSATLDDGSNLIHTFPTAGRLFAQASGNKIRRYEAELTIFDPETQEKRLLPLKRTELREGLETPPPGSKEPRCVEWRERCFGHEIIQPSICDTVCTKVYDPETKETYPVTKPPYFYITISTEYGKFRREHHNPKKLQRRQRPADEP